MISFTGTEPTASLMEATNLQAWLSEGLQDSTIVHWCGSRIYSVSISHALSGPSQGRARKLTLRVEAAGLFAPCIFPPHKPAQNH